MGLRKAVFVLLLITLAACSTLASQPGSLRAERTADSKATGQARALTAELPAVRIVELMKDKVPVAFARFGQCQFSFAPGRDGATGLPVASADGEAKIEQCLEIAGRERVNVLVLPELAMAFPKEVREKVLERARTAATRNDMIIIAGTFYDEQRFSRLAVISDTGLVAGYKLRPSRYEASPRFGLGMQQGESLLVLHTPYGRLAIVTCVDLISDAVQYTLRSLATRGEIDVIVNINYNPAAWEFLVEANSIARRHPVFVSITNVAGAPALKEKCFSNGRPADDGFCFGNSALFGSMRTRTEDCPNCFKAIEEFVGDQFKVQAGGQRSIPYDTMLANIPFSEEAMLLYELNMRMKQEPLATNAPDQGYPTVRGLRKIPLKSP
ncbi:MAG: nitrilase-related carbon-nitrogen hydrolase [Syntrophobacteraceae bacterium]